MHKLIQKALISQFLDMYCICMLNNVIIKTLSFLNIFCNKTTPLTYKLEYFMSLFDPLF